MEVLGWLKTSNRDKHLIGGLIIGMCADDWYCAGYAGGLVGCAMEFKDRAYGGEWDWIDAGCTFAGALLGYGLKRGIMLWSGLM